jgi:hypothetical protein
MKITKVPSVPPGVQLEPGGVCSAKAFDVAMSKDGRSVRLNIVDDRDQLFPIGLSERDLCNLLQIVGYMSQDMAITQEELGGEPGVNIVSGRDGASLPPLRMRFGWSPSDQMATLIIGNAGLKFPMSADTAKAIGQAIVDQASPHATGAPTT